MACRLRPAIDTELAVPGPVPAHLHGIQQPYGRRTLGQEQHQDPPPAAWRPGSELRKCHGRRYLRMLPRPPESNALCAVWSRWLPGDRPGHWKGIPGGGDPGSNDQKVVPEVEHWDAERGWRP